MSYKRVMLCIRWLLEKAAIQRMWRFMVQVWRTQDWRPMSQRTSLWTAARRDRVRHGPKSSSPVIFYVSSLKVILFFMMFFYPTLLFLASQLWSWSSGFRCYNKSLSWLFCFPGDVSIGIKCAPGVVGPAEADIDFDIIKNDNDTFTVKYMPPGPGQYTIMVLFADQVRADTGELLLQTCSRWN